MSYKLTHPDSAMEIDAEADQVSLYATQGWVTKPSVKAPETAPDTVGVTDPSLSADPKAK